MTIASFKRILSNSIDSPVCQYKTPFSMKSTFPNSVSNVPVIWYGSNQSQFCRFFFNLTLKTSAFDSKLSQFESKNLFCSSRTFSKTIKVLARNELNVVCLGWVCCVGIGGKDFVIARFCFVRVWWYSVRILYSYLKGNSRHEHHRFPSFINSDRFKKFLVLLNNFSSNIFHCFEGFFSENSKKSNDDMVSKLVLYLFSCPVFWKKDRRIVKKYVLLYILLLAPFTLNQCIWMSVVCIHKRTELF